MFLFLGLGQNSLLSLLAVVVFVFGTFLLWRPGETPVLLLIFCYQWLQASVGLFYANWQDINIDRLSSNGGRQELASLLTLIGLLFFAGGVRLGTGAPNAYHVHLSRRMIEAQPQSRWVRIFVGAWVMATAAQSLAFLIPGLSQLFLGIAGLKWSAYFLLTYATFAKPDSGKTVWSIVFLAEFAISLGGYFSSFSEVFFYTLMALVASRVRVSPRVAIVGGTFAAGLLYVGVVWTAVKVEYRSYLRGDQNAQVITVGYQDRITKLFDLIFDLKADDIGNAVNHTIERLTYVEFFGVALDYVPAMVPHENGSLWFDALTRPLMPRIFFPEKEVIDESALTNKYTGLNVSGLSQGTQITIGYMGESYIDFGEFGMMPAIFLVGLALGRLYRWLIRGVHTRGALGMALATSALMPAAYLETSTAKIVGGLFASILAAWLVAKFIVPRFAPWLLARNFEQAPMQMAAPRTLRPDVRRL